MFNFGLIGAAYAMMHATHGIADYWLQTDWQAQNKAKNWTALLNHVFSYSIAFIPTGQFLFHCDGISLRKALLLPLVIGIPHLIMDRRRFLNWFLLKAKGWRSEDMATLPPVVVAVRLHVSIALHQKFHHLCLFLTALWLGHNA
jgi:hypothetical protein